MLEVVRRCWPDRLAGNAWQKRISKLLPSFGQDPIKDPALLLRMKKRADYCLKLV